MNELGTAHWELADQEGMTAHEGMADHVGATANEGVPHEIQAALEANVHLRQALDDSGLPTRFSAMVLGLATLRQLNQEQRRHEGFATEATARRNSMGWGVLS